MGNKKQGNGDDFLKGHIADDNLRHAHHHHGEHCPDPHLHVTFGGHPQIGADCCWIILATTNCTTSLPNGATCCWRFLATTDCTTTLRGQECCWIVLASTNCTTTQGDAAGCDES